MCIPFGVMCHNLKLRRGFTWYLVLLSLKLKLQCAASHRPQCAAASATSLRPLRSAASRCVPVRPAARTNRPTATQHSAAAIRHAPPRIVAHHRAQWRCCAAIANRTMQQKRRTTATFRKGPRLVRMIQVPRAMGLPIFFSCGFEAAAIDRTIRPCAGPSHFIALKGVTICNISINRCT